MNCREVRALEHAYVDGEIDVATSLELESHVACCAECAARQASLKLLSARIRIEAPRHAAGDALRERIAAMVPAEAPAETPKLRSRRSRLPASSVRMLRPAVALAFAFTLGWAASLVFAPSDTRLRTTDEVVAGHIRALRANQLTEIASSDRHTVKPWLTAKLDFAAPVADLAADGFPLAGGRVDHLSRQTVAALVYRRREHVINLFVWPDQRDTMQPVTLAAERGFNVARFSTGGMQFAAVSDLNAGELRTFAELVAARR